MLMEFFNSALIPCLSVGQNLRMDAALWSCRSVHSAGSVLKCLLVCMEKCSILLQIMFRFKVFTLNNHHYCFVSQVDRSDGDLSAVTVYWEVDPSSEGELLTTFGNITFGVGQTSQNITITVAQDEIPELDKNVTVSLVNVSHGRLGDLTSATLTLLASDDPYGVFIFSNKTRSVRLPEADSTVSLTILRQKGLMGRVSSLDFFSTISA